MPEELRALNEEGRRQYREWLEKLRDNSALPAPYGLLEDPACAFAPVPGLQLPRGPFKTKLELAASLLPLIEQVEGKRLPEERWPGVWDGLALAYFDEICPTNAGGNRKFGEIERYIWDPRHTRFYKHRIAAPVTLFRVHRDHSIIFLCGAPSVLSDYEIQVCSRQDWMSCTAVGQICCELYWDSVKRLTKKGGMSKTKPGALFHLIRVLQHLERTFDLQGMDGNGLAMLLPEAFRGWLPEKELFNWKESVVPLIAERPSSMYTSGAALTRVSRPEAALDREEALMEKLKINEQYTREQLAELWGYASFHAFARGVFTPKDTQAIILFVTEDSDKGEMPRYINVLAGDSLAWEGPEDHFAEDRIIASDQSGDEIYVFYRELHRSPFRYLGAVQLQSFTRHTERPSRFVFKLRGS